MRNRRWSIAVVAAVLLGGGCASSDGVRAERTASVVASNGGAAPPPLVPGRAGAGPCALGAVPAGDDDRLSQVEPSASSDVDDPGQRARRALAEQRRPTPRRGVVAEDAADGAEACVHELRVRFSLLTNGGAKGGPDERMIAETLRSAGLARVVIGAGPVFAGSTGAACVHGTFAAAEPAFTIGPRKSDGSCPP